MGLPQRQAPFPLPRPLTLDLAPNASPSSYLDISILRGLGGDKEEDLVGRPRSVNWRDSDIPLVRSHLKSMGLMARLFH